MQNANLYYLENVLGIRHYLRPADSVSMHVCVLVAKELSTQEHELLVKMLAAVEILQFHVEVMSETAPEASGYVLIGGAQVTLPDDSPTVLLPKLSELLGEAHDARIRNAKKIAWEKLKVFKKSLEK